MNCEPLKVVLKNRYIQALLSPQQRWGVTNDYEAKETGMRIGIGYDVHRLVEGRKLVLGGETIPGPKGLLGHSDADVLVHAICDALIGAAGLGDIGTFFPDTDPEFKDISSLELLSIICKKIRENGFEIVNVDSTLLAENPRLSPYREAMKTKIARSMGLDPDCVSIKATTTEGLGAIGRGEGIASMSIALLKPVSDDNKPD